MGENKYYWYPDHRYTFDITLDAISYARYKNEDDEFEPHRKPISLYTPHIGIDSAMDNCVFIDITKQYNRIMQFFDIYEEAYGEWPVRDYKIAGMTMIGRMGYVQYGEAFKKITWRSARKYLD